MTSVGTVEINLKLNTGKLDSQIDKLKNIQIKPDLGRIQPQLTVPVKFADNSYKRQIDELRNHVSKNSEIDIDAKLSEKSIARIKAQLQDIAISINFDCKGKGKGKTSPKPNDYENVNIDNKPKPKKPSGGSSDIATQNKTNKELIENNKKNTITVTTSIKNNVISINNSIERVSAILKEIEKSSKKGGGIFDFILGGVNKLFTGVAIGVGQKVGGIVYTNVVEESESFKKIILKVDEIVELVANKIKAPVDSIATNIATQIADGITNPVVDFIDNFLPVNSNKNENSNQNIDSNTIEQESNLQLLQLPQLQLEDLKIPEYDLLPIEVPVVAKLKELKISENDIQPSILNLPSKDFDSDVLPKSYKKNIKKQSVGRIKNNTKSSGEIVSGILENLNIPALSIPDNDIKTVSAKLREEFTAKGLLQIAKGLGIKPTGKNRNLEPLSKIIAESASIPDIKVVAKSLGDEVRRATKKTGESNIKPILNSSNGKSIVKYLKDANKQLNDRILAFNEFGKENVENIVNDIDVYINSIDEIIKNNNYEPKIGQSLGGLVSQLKYKRESLVGNDRSLGVDAPKPLASSKPVLMPIISSLTAKGVNDYQEIIKGLAVKLETGIDSIKIPDIKPSTSLPDGIKAAYEELTNTIYVSQDAIDILNSGIGDSIENLGEETVNETISFLIHELTHAFQASVSGFSLDELSGGIDVNTESIKLPSVGGVLSDEIEKLSEQSTKEYIKQLQHLNPGKSLKQLETQYKNLISEVKKREKEAYIAQTVLTGEIVKGFKKQVSEPSNQQNESINLPTLLASVGSVPSSQQPANNIIQSVGEAVNGFFGEFQSSFSNIPIPQIPQVDVSILTENISQAVQEGVQNAVQTVANNVVKTGVSVAANGAVIMAKAVGNAVAEQANTLAENFQETFSEEIANIKMPELISNITAPLPHQEGYRPIRQQPGAANPTNKYIGEDGKAAKWVGRAIKDQLGLVNDLMDFIGLFESFEDFLNKMKPKGLIKKLFLIDAEVTDRVDEVKSKFFGFIEDVKKAKPGLAPFIGLFEQAFDMFRRVTVVQILGKYLGGLAKASLETAGRFQVLRNTTEFLAGSSKKAVETFAFLSSEVVRLGLDTEMAIKSWNKLAATTRGTVLEGDTTKDIFSAISQAGRSFGLTTEEMEGSILALSQIAGKGVVSMEELRGQLAERIPGAFQMAARAMGITEQELTGLISTGKVAATDFLPKFAKQLSMETAGGVEKASKTIAAATTRYKNAISVFQEKFGGAMLKTVTWYYNTLAGAIENVSKHAALLGLVFIKLIDNAFFGFLDNFVIMLKIMVSTPNIIKTIGVAFVTLKQIIMTVLMPVISELGRSIVGGFLYMKALEGIIFLWGTFVGKLKTDDINKYLSKSFIEAGKKTDELREKLGKLRGEIDRNGKPIVKASTNVSNVLQQQEVELRKKGAFGLSAMDYNLRDQEVLMAYFKDFKEKREAKALKESASTGEIKTLTSDVNNILSSSDLIIAKAIEKNDAIGRLTVQAKNAEGKNLENIKKQIEILQTEAQVELFKNGGKTLGLSNVESTTENVAATIEKLKTQLEDTGSSEPKQAIIDQIKRLEEYKERLEYITEIIGSSDSITQFLITIGKIGLKFEQASFDTDKALIKIKTSINKNLKDNLTKNVGAENNASLEQARSEIFATQAKLKASKDLVDELTGTLKGSSGQVGEYFNQFKDFSLLKLQSELQKTDDKDTARKSTLEALIKLREGEGATLELQSTLQEQLLQQERERFRIAQENLDRQLAISRATVDINDARNQSVSVRRQIMGGSSQADIGLIDAENQVNIAKQREALREQELAGIKKLQADKLISAKDYENKVRELTIQGAQNSLAILQASLQQEQALRAKEVEKIQRELEQAKVKSEAKQTDIGFNVERKGFDIQQNNIKEQISTAQSDEIGKQLDYQKQIAEKSGDISKQEKISAEIYQNQLASLAVKQDLQTKSLELTQAQQRLEMQRSEMQAQVALLEAESQVNQLQANKATAEEIAIAQQTVDIRQKQVNFISEQKANLSEVQKLEQQNLSVQNETQKKDLERSRNLQVIEEDEKRISKEIEIAKSNNELRNKEIERSSQLLNSQLELYKVQSDYKKSELDFQTELANKVNNVSALETIKAISYADQVASLKVQNLAQTESLKLTQEQQRIQAEIDVLDAQATLRKLELNKGSAQDIELAKQQLDAAQQQLGNLEAIQSNERERVGIEQQSALKNLERQQYLEMQDLAVKKITSSLEQQSKLFNAQQNVAQSNAELDKQRLDYQLELANRSGDINRVEQLKAEIYLQQREEILRQGDAQLKSLDITQKQNNIELERQKLMAQSLLLEAKANLEKGKLKGASAQELNDLQQYVTIQEQQLSGIQQLVSANQEVQSLEKQQLEIQQQTKLEQIDQQRQLELIDLQAQKITKSYELQQQQLDLNNSELERQSALVNAKSGLNDSVSNLEKQRLDFRMQLAELAENEVQKQQIKQQLYEQELKSLAQRQAIERETLKIAQLKQNIDIKRQEIQAEIATLEAQANIEQAKARGAGESELAALYKVLALRMQQEKSVQADKVNLAQIQELERQKLNVDQTAASENLQFQQTIEQTRSAKEQQQKASEGNKSSSSGNIPLNINIPPFQPIPIEEVKISKTDSDKKNEIIESMKVTATNVYINGTVSASSGQNVNIETQNSDLEKVKKIENEINKLAEESRLKAANAAMDDYINKWNSDAEKERIASGLSAEQATAGGYEQARLAREEAERIKADLASGKLKTTGAEGFKPQAIMTPLQKLQAELDAAQKAVDSSKNKPNKNTSNSQETEGGTNVNVENLVIVSSDPTGDARQVLNDLAANKGKC